MIGPKWASVIYIYRERERKRERERERDREREGGREGGSEISKKINMQTCNNKNIKEIGGGMLNRIRNKYIE